MQEEQPVKQEQSQEKPDKEQRLSWNEYHDIVEDALKEGNPICPYCD